MAGFEGDLKEKGLKQHGVAAPLGLHNGFEGDLKEKGLKLFHWAEL